jgi:hypothetical protein
MDDPPVTKIHYIISDHLEQISVTYLHHSPPQVLIIAIHDPSSQFSDPSIILSKHIRLEECFRYSDSLDVEVQLVIHPNIFWIEFAILPTADECVDEGVLSMCPAFKRLVFCKLGIVSEELAFNGLQ